MEALLGFGNDLATKKVCKLKKALYRLKQSPRTWFRRFSKLMKNMRYKQNQEDHTLFIKHSDLEGVIAFLVYVDDIIMRGNDELERQTLRQCLTKEFEIKELGRLKYLIGIEVAYSKQGIFISLQKCAVDLLKEMGKLACKPANTSVDPNYKLGEAEENTAIDREMRQHLVRRLIYLFYTRSDMTYVASVISQFIHSSTEVLQVTK